MNEIPPRYTGEYTTAAPAPDQNASMKREIARLGLLAASALVLMIVTATLLATLESLLVRVFGAFGDEAEQIFAFFQYFLMFAPPLLLLWLTNRSRMGDMTRFLSPDANEGKLAREVVLCFPVLLGVTYAMDIVSTALSDAFAWFGLFEPPLFEDEPTTAVGWVFYALTLCVVAPLCEELFFRGALLGLLKPYGAGFAVAVQAILFSVFHRTVAQMPYTLAGGLLFGFLAVRYGGILPTLLLHMLNNAFSFAIDPLFSLAGDDPLKQMLFTGALYLLAVGGGILIVALWSKRERGLFRFAAGKADDLPGLSAFRAFFLQPAMIVYLALSAYELLAFMML